MTNETSHSETAVDTMADPELEQLLGEAYDAPAVPRSLLKRIDQGIENEWGVSPRLSDTPGARVGRTLLEGTHTVAGGARWAGRALPAAAALGVMIVLGVVFNASSRSYAWADVLQAIMDRGVLQVDEPEGTRWLALAEGVAGEQTAQSARMISFREQFALQRVGTSDTIQRYHLAETAVNDPNRLLIRFLIDDVDGSQARLEFDSLRLITESSQRVSTDSGDGIELRTQFDSSSGPLEVQMLLEEGTGLPQTFKVLVAGKAAGASAVTYSPLPLQQLQERQFPRELAIVDVESPLPARVTAVPGEADSRPSPDLPSPLDQLMPIEQEGSVGDDSVTDDVDPTTTLMAAATTWKPVAVKPLESPQVLQQVNATLANLWQEHDVEPTQPADDEELLRRVYLDLAGRTPSVHEVRAYLKDDSEQRYERLVELLLSSPDHASHLATVWRTFLIPEGVDLTAFGGVAAFDEWLAQRFAANDAYDDVVRSLLLAEGRLSKSGPLLFYSAVKLDPDQLASRTARVFLGMRLECAQCHDHPFEPWTQEDFWSYAAFFAQISRPKGALENVSTVMRVRDIDRGDVMLPETDTVVPPRFLGGSEIVAGEGTPARRQQLAEWLTSADNPYFPRAAANRVWGHLFGKGIIDPVDDFGEMNPPVSPELLDLLAGHFIRSGFDLRELFRTVVLSEAYRLSSAGGAGSQERQRVFAQMNIKTLTAEQVYDCISVATMLDAPPDEALYGMNVVRFGNAEREAFLQQFRTPVGRMTEYHGGIPQALTLMNGGLISGATGLSTSGLLSSLEAPFFTNEQRIEVLYMATLSRRPRASEWDLLKGYIPEGATGTELKEGLADVLWALLNSAEFTMNH